jgi:plasmid maintenance system antidote protein VapI
MVKKLKPIHPGEQLREEFMVPLGLSSNALGRALGSRRRGSTRSCAAGAVLAQTRRCAWRASSAPHISSG